ncbi:MAG: zinc-binding alcohol dehydrogenase [Rhodospirillaceae bacterium]|nr:zinc-binding alcohol dehydrogenase [Rhodospirillaceae bacterium]
MPQSDALWYVADGRVETRAVDVPALHNGEVRVAARYSGVSRGTERLVLQGRVPPSEYERMRCPRQEGAFPFPVKYGYALAGVIEDGPKEHLGRNVFLLHPHQRVLNAPRTDVHFLPKDVPLRRAALAANMETALNVIWDADVLPGDKVLIVGGGVLGLLIAGIAARIPGTTITVADTDATRAAAIEKMGAVFATPDNAPPEQDVVIHTSSSEDGLRTALRCAGTEARVVEASWFGNRAIAVPLGEAFHARRLQLVSSQVGAVPAARRARWTYARRMAAALDLLRDARFEALITNEIAFADAPAKLPAALTSNAGFMTILTYT